jgi:Flp pilus assembly protein CpaB
LAIQPNKPQNRVFLLVGIVLAAAAAVAVLFAVSHNSGSNVATTNVVVAKTTIAAGTPITADLLTTSALQQGSFPADTFTDPTQAVGKVAPVTLSANIPLTASLFASSTTGTPGAVATHLDITKGYVALAIPASFSAGAQGNPNLAGEFVSVGYYIQPEDHIDIIVDAGTATNPALRYSFQDVRVLRVGSAATTSAAGTTTGTVNSYVIELPRNQAEIMTALVANRGNFSQVVVRYVLRPQAEWGKRDGTNGFDKPNYESSTGTPLTVGADTPVTPATLNGLFPG